MLTKRRIEAEMLGYVYEVLKTSHGKDTAMQATGDAARLLPSTEPASSPPKGRAPTSLQSFVELSAHLRRRRRAENRGARKDDTEYVFDLVRCRSADLYKSMGLSEIGPSRSCQRDRTFCEG